MRNQMMNVPINKDLTIRIGHVTRLGKVDEVMAYGNLLRELRGLRPIELKQILKRQEFWEFVIARNAHKASKSQKSQSSDSELWNIEADFSQLEKYKTKNGEIQYSKLIKQFPALIKSVRGGKVENRGHYMELYLLLKVASMLDKQLEVQIYEVFIEKKILELRDSGGEGFKRLNRLIAKLPDFNPERSKDYHKEISRLIRNKVFNLPDYSKYENIWNSDIATPEKLDERDTLIEKLEMLLEENFITTYLDLYHYLGGNDKKIENYIKKYVKYTKKIEKIFWSN